MMPDAEATHEVAELLAELPAEALLPVHWVLARLQAPAKVDDGESVTDLSCADVAAMLHRKPGTIRSWCSRGLIPGAYRLNNRDWRVPRAGLRAFLDEQARGQRREDAAAPVALGRWRKVQR